MRGVSCQETVSGDSRLSRDARPDGRIDSQAGGARRHEGARTRPHGYRGYPESRVRGLGSAPSCVSALASCVWRVKADLKSHGTTTNKNKTTSTLPPYAVRPQTRAHNHTHMSHVTSRVLAVARGRVSSRLQAPCAWLLSKVGGSAHRSKPRAASPQRSDGLRRNTPDAPAASLERQQPSTAPSSPPRHYPHAGLLSPAPRRLLPHRCSSLTG